MREGARASGRLAGSLVMSDNVQLSEMKHGLWLWSNSVVLANRPKLIISVRGHCTGRLLARWLLHCGHARGSVPGGRLADGPSRCDASLQLRLVQMTVDRPERASAWTSGCEAEARESA